MTNLKYWFGVLSVFFFIACNQENVEPELETGLEAITEGITDQANFKVTLLSEDTLFHGYNKVWFAVEDQATGEKVTNASLSLYPEMDMIDMKHSAPFENPDQMANENGLFEGAVVFIMPDTDEMKWRLKVNLNVDNTSDSVWLLIPHVKSLEEPKIINFISAVDQKKYFVSLVEPVNPKVGINKLILAIHYKENMMSFPGDENVSVAINPQMPSMDHGSPNNVNPIHTKGAYYEGKVNFTMTGWWRIYIDLKKDGVPITDGAYIDLTF